MYLQSLEIIGFKSFAAKTILNFNPGVTAVVGPNGCGKSNVLDALRWVLGEQSAKALRGGEMADVIFSGTDSRQALGMAEVSLSFTDCEKELGVEWNEVRITRRVFRDGKSEYLLNKAPCRLKDIHQLFMDTGIGRSAYSIMEQGKIDAILSSRPEDRRAIFEEAAGITKYKAQKKEALRKLEYTEANLVRVSDIIKEVKRQIGSLQRQAAKARRYQALMEDLRTFDLHLSHRNYQRLIEEQRSVQAALESGDDVRQAGEVAIAGLEAELEACRERLAELDLRVSETRDNIQSQRNRIYAGETRVATNAERVGEAGAMIERYEYEIASGEEKLRQQESEIARTDEQIAEMLTVLRAGEERLTAASDRVNQARSSRVSAERAANDLASEVGQIESRLSALRGQASSAAGRREAAEARLQILRSEESMARDAKDSIALRAQESVHRLELASVGSAAAQSELDDAEARATAAQSARQDAENASNAANRTVAEQESRLEILRQLNEEGEGFGEGTQAVLRGLDQPDLIKSAIEGALASLIHVQPDYIPAVEAALGVHLQAIVFKDVQVAEVALRYLADKKLGRAAILPREWISADQLPRPGTEQLPDGAVAWAEDCVTFSSESGVLARNLLRGVVIVSSLDQAIALKPHHPGLAMATLSGEFISKDGIVHAGRSGENSASALVRKNQILSLERDVAESRMRMEFCVNQRAAALDELDQAQDQLKAARESVQSARVELSTAQNEASLLERQMRDAETRCTTFERESIALALAAQDASTRATDFESLIAAGDQELAEARGRQADVYSMIDEARDRERTVEQELNDLRVQIATERQQQESLARQRDPMAARIAELTELLAQRRRDIDQYASRIASLEAESAELQSSISTWQMLLETGEQEISGLVAERTDAKEQSDSVEESMRAARVQLAALQDQRARHEVRAAQLAMRIEHVMEHVTTRFHVEISAFSPDHYGLIKALREREKARAKAAAAGDTSVVEDQVIGDQPIGAEPVAIAAAEIETPQPAETEIPAEFEIPWGVIEELVAELSGKLDSMGPVNLDAIQEYDELEQRYTFLEQQNSDLINSKAELMEVISKINRTTKELFAETFEKIRVNFQEMFTELFGGGKANLVLSDESDPLESGIDIIARPPGKQLQSITLLSGGEKTMTAVALLFSIYMVKPSPFCVLDEMDAPLDESNISRFIKILDRFVDQSQFVVITHNKRTIGRADMVFGVTMEEHGVSKVVSVKFTERQENPTAESESSVAEAFGKDGQLHSERTDRSAESALV
jgi:chromosome segregation protein